ncbi:hypothetical protein ZYGR_0S01220 [Zygosaccharomyces rouxii]|uniref:Enolase-phosphatase E1 n=2 Tax=Zygosaccharomyces rouxii TaxID=4956 RepID=ENOPH_ZYGRC|nr:uncharacterized protein ZYRO0F05236g [Zygosaccharomyces rouxii]C5DXI0.1 RecName: Full=Enolase-phosphatase E1; AltName: Full=2,3-diketo-5-methylthio-1-phosphopentane phosphatase [Zygosaccharomyces rouxii CBS 732]KAH9199252.1 enolase-phosphatase E1 [Zygosaccharomyces rouxii]GAV49989.1 hypothetical protein ZYGR_0S01220 [Zygosaccharomyces rouxii]CAR28491.1 ZYRO0F05236p [Zygosaccharomyces rouxii]
MSVSVYLLDIEGTVCPISFVKETLFPYFSAKLPSLVKSDDVSIKSVLAQFPQHGDSQALQTHIQSLVSNDVKDPTLKQLQGTVWSQGYTSGEIKAPVYKDAIEFMKRKENVYIYSSGSVQAQKLLFGHVANPDNSGSNESSLDLNPLIKGYFDINTSGKKLESSSYEKIVTQIGVAAEQVLFISDNVKELEAAHAAGVKTLLAIRPGNPPVQENHGFRTVEKFDSL